jgi:Flp pilus assembly protein TadG
MKAFRCRRWLASGRGRHSRGAIALMTAILLPVLLAFSALVVDIGRMFVFKAELQNAMDACALAAVSPLNGSADPTIFDVARAHGLALTDPSRVGLAARNPITVNKLHFQRDQLTLANINVEFSTALNGTWVAATSTSYAGITPQTAQYVRCTYNDANNPLFFVPILRAIVPGAATTLSVGATAAAALRPSQGTCTFPIGVCAAPGSTSATNFGHTVGERLVAVNNPGSGYGTGNFGWLDFSPPAGGASELTALMTGSGSCGVSVGHTVGQPGVVNSAQTAWNTRFGVYKGAVSTPPPFVPDFTGFGFPTGSNNYATFVTQTSARSQFQGSVGGGAWKISSANHALYGQKRRVVTAAVVDCSVWNGGGGGANPPVLDFACILLLGPVQDGGSPASWSDVAPTMDVEFLGLASAVGTPCASGGLAGGVYGPPVPTLVQ